MFRLESQDQHPPDRATASIDMVLPLPQMPLVDGGG